MVPKNSLGMALIAVGIALPVGAYAAGRVFNMEVASYGGPPNQGAMVGAYLLIQVACVIGACLALAGFFLVMKAPSKPVNAEIDHTH